jgi:hypothetical protein
MDRRERKDVLGQWGARLQLPHELVESRKVAEALEGSPLAGRALPRRPRLFRTEADSYVASLGGPLPYMVRLREIERLTAAAEAELEERWRSLARDCARAPVVFASRWRLLAEGWNFVEVNELIDRHNRWYPVEARLPFDPRRRDYVKVGGRHYSRRPLDAAWILERFPPELGRAQHEALR